MNTTDRRAPAVIPYSVLMAIQSLDTPVDDGVREHAEEVLAKRLGLSDTVVLQAMRYEPVVRAGGSVDTEETVGLLRLVGRRPDHELVYADAGRRAARYVVRHQYARALVVTRLHPLRRRARARLAGRLIRRVFDGVLEHEGGDRSVRVARPLSIRAFADGRACVFYGAAFAEVLRLVCKHEVALEHAECQGRDDPSCRWQTTRASELTR